MPSRLAVTRQIKLAAEPALISRLTNPITPMQALAPRLHTVVKAAF